MKKWRIRIWEKFAYWNDDKQWDYRWWPVVASQYNHGLKMLMIELWWLRWRVGVSIIAVTVNDLRDNW